MDITGYLGEGLIFTDLSAPGKEEAFGAMVDHIVAQGAVSPEIREKLLEKLREREGLANTFVGNGAAIPHAFLGLLDRGMIAVGRFKDGVEYGGTATEPVRLMFMIIGPEQDPRAHMRLLACLVRVIKNKPLMESILGSRSPEEIGRLLARAAGG